jgi:hypothetical protein
VLVDPSIVTPITARKAVIAAALYGIVGLAAGVLTQRLVTTGKPTDLGETVQLAVSMFALWTVLVALIARVSGQVWQGGLNTMVFFAAAVLAYYLCAWQRDEAAGSDWRAWGLIVVTVVPVAGVAIAWASLPSHPGWGWGALRGPVLAVPIGTVLGEALVLHASRHVDADSLILVDSCFAVLLAWLLPRTWPARILAVVVAIPIAFVVRDFWDSSYIDAFNQVRDWVGLDRPDLPG